MPGVAILSIGISALRKETYTKIRRPDVQLNLSADIKAYL